MFRRQYRSGMTLSRSGLVLLALFVAVVATATATAVVYGDRTTGSSFDAGSACREAAASVPGELVGAYRTDARSARGAVPDGVAVPDGTVLASCYIDDGGPRTGFGYYGDPPRVLGVLVAPDGTSVPWRRFTPSDRPDRAFP